MKLFALSGPFDRMAPRLSGLEGESLWRAAVRGESSQTLHTQQSMGGSRWKDFLWTTLAGTPIIAERLCKQLQDGGLTGWQTYPVVVLDATGVEVQGYRGLAINGRCRGRIGFDRHESALTYRPSAKGEPMPWFQGLHFNADTWDQDGSGWIIVSERVQTLFKRAKVSNCVLEDIESVNRPATPSEIIRTESQEARHH